MGGLIGYSSAGRIGASWSSVNVTTDASNARAGGLGGRLGGDSIIAVYSTGVISTSGDNAFAGGLMGEMEALSGAFISAYVTGPAIKTGDGEGGATGALYGVASGLASNAVLGLYWNTETTGFANRSGIQERGYDTTALQTPTAYAATIYAGWDADVDGDATADDPWDFGATMDYPKLKWDGMSVTEQTIMTTTRTAAMMAACAW